MKTTVELINRIITALDKLEVKGCHSIFCEYGNGLFRVRIIHLATGKISFERTINIHNELKEADEMLKIIVNMRFNIWTTTFQCYKRKFVLGKKAGKWGKTKPIIEFGDNATQSMLTDDSGYYIDDPDNGMQYFVNYKEQIETDK